jgi:hypothetical protein
MVSDNGMRLLPTGNEQTKYKPLTVIPTAHFPAYFVDLLGCTYIDRFPANYDIIFACGNYVVLGLTKPEKTLYHYGIAFISDGMAQIIIDTCLAVIEHDVVVGMELFYEKLLSCLIVDRKETWIVE